MELPIRLKGFPKIKAKLWEVPVIRTIVLGGLTS